MTLQLKLEQYGPELETAWDHLVGRSANGTFLQSRRFLGYHGSRFVDASLALKNDKAELVGVFPAASSTDGVADSHPGATHGGLVHDGTLRGNNAVAALEAVCRHLRERGFERLRYKTIPFVFQRYPSADDAWALQVLGGSRTRCDLSCILDLSDRPKAKDGRKDDLRKARRAGLTTSSGLQQLPEFWPLLEQTLAARHGSKPVHTLAEVSDLAARFPGDLELIGARAEGRLLAGALLFRFPRALHTQYLASSEEGQSVGALTLALETTMQLGANEQKRWLSLGASTIDAGRQLNHGLYDWKASFGATGMVHETYELAL